MFTARHQHNLVPPYLQSNGRRNVTAFRTAWCMASLAWIAAAQPVGIDTQKSTMTVRVYKAGFLSAFGHDHQIAAPVSGGTVDVSARQVEVHAQAGTLRVQDADVSDKDRAEIQKTMLGPQVLDSERYAEIVFRSESAGAAGAGGWKVRGNLQLHGQSRPVEVEVREMGGHYVGSARFKQSDFGIKPVKAAGGTVQVKDELKIEFDIQLKQ